jgi:hypothetical protein
MTVRVNKPAFNLREKLSELTSKFGLKGTELARAETVQDARNTISAGRKNLLFNGAMNVDQRNNGATMNATTAAEYCLDRWRTISSASNKFEVKQVNRAEVTPPEGFSHAMRITSLAATTVGASDYYVIQQRIEGNTLPGFSNSQTPITVSFWIRSSLTGTYSGAWTNVGYTQYYPFQFTINKVDTWEYKTITIPGSGNNYIDGNSQSATLIISLGVGTNYSEPASGGWTFQTAFGADNSTDFVGTNGVVMYLTGVQAEVGENATDFEFKPFAEELALCYRYFYRKKTFNAKTVWFYSTSGASCQIDFPTEMRANPTFSYNGVLATDINVYYGPIANYVTFTGFTASIVSGQSSRINVTGITPAVTAGYAGGLYMNSSAYLDWSAEL